MDCSKCDSEMVAVSPRGPRFIGPPFKIAKLACPKGCESIEVPCCIIHREPMDDERGSRRAHNIRSCRVSSCPRGWEIPVDHPEYVKPGAKKTA